MDINKAIEYVKIQCINLGVDFIEVESYSDSFIEYAYLENNEEVSDILYL